MISLIHATMTACFELKRIGCSTEKASGMQDCHFE